MKEQATQLATKNAENAKLEAANSKQEDEISELKKKLAEYESMLKLTRDKDEKMKELVEKYEHKDWAWPEKQPMNNKRELVSNHNPATKRTHER